MANLVNKSGKAAPEKPNFTQTCNLLSQYLKERGRFGDINLGINGKIEAKGSESSRLPKTTLNLLPDIEQNSSAENPSRPSLSAEIKTADFFPKFVGSGSPYPVEDSANKSADLRKPPSSIPADPVPAQMTIFYGGRVMVFDDFPADKAKEIFALAAKGSSNTTNGFLTSLPTASAMDKSRTPSVSNDAGGEGLQLRPQDTNGSDLPIARRASLHRFLEKRKER
nr:TIFY 10A protein [Jatropha curcas]